MLQKARYSKQIIKHIWGLFVSALKIAVLISNQTQYIEGMIGPHRPIVGKVVKIPILHKIGREGTVKS